MSVWFGKAAERDALPYPQIPPNSQAGGYGMSFTNPVTHNAESAMRKVAVFAATNLLAGLAAELPLDGYTGTGSDRREVNLPVFFTDPDGSGQGMGDWLYQLMYSWLLRGNAVGLILARDALQRPTQIQLQHPDACGAWQDENGVVKWYINGRERDTSEVWHRRAFPVPGKYLGLSPIALHALTIGQGLAASAFGLRWFTDGAHPSGMLTNDSVETITDDQATTLKARFLAAIRGTREPVVMGKGWKYQAIQVNAEESQFLDTQKMTAAECARIFGPGVPEVLGYETGGSLTYSNVEQRSLDLLKFSLNRWLVRIETILSNDVLSRPRYVKYNRGALLQTDLLTRYRAHEIALRNKFLVVNEVRDLEEYPHVDWGDEPVPSAGDPIRLETLP